MRQVLEKLMALQKVDSEIQKLENLKGDLPQQVENLNQHVEERTRSLEERKEHARTGRMERDTAERAVQELEETLKKYQNQLYEVKNNREYDAVQMEIENVRQKISEREGRILELMDRDEALQEAMTTDEAALEDLRKKLEIKQADLKQKIKETEAEETGLRVRREKIIKEIQPRLLANYDRVRLAKGGLAVVPIVRNGCCGGCFKQLPPQRVMEVRDMDRPITCEVCGRILVWDEEAYQQTSTDQAEG